MCIRDRVKILKADIPFVSMLAQARLIRVHGANSSQLAQMRKEELEEEDGKIGPAGKIALAKEKDTDGLEKQLTAAQGQISVLKQKIENEKNKAIKPMPNPETGEVPLRTGLANAILDKKMDTKKLVQQKKKDEIKVGGKTKIEINPDVEIGQFSGGMRTNSGNLH